MTDQDTANALYIERSTQAARINAAIIVANTQNRPLTTAAAYNPKKKEFIQWAMDPSQGKYPNALVTEEKMKRFIFEELLITDNSGTIISGRLQRKRGKQRKDGVKRIHTSNNDENNNESQNNDDEDNDESQELVANSEGGEDRLISSQIKTITLNLIKMKNTALWK